MSENKLQHCSFCGSSKDEVRKLIVGDDVAICSQCVELCSELISNDIVNYKEGASIEKQDFNPYAIKQHLDDLVIGQEHAKMVLSVAIANHYKRINNKSAAIELQKGNVLLIGPTGSGKTFMARSVAKFLNVPFVIADATSLTEAGYVGDDVETMLSMLLANADNDVEKAEKGIIFIDEIDKISRKGENVSITRDVSGEGVQQALLKIIEGTVCRVNAIGKRKHPQSETIEIDTTNILFIAGGAFVGLDSIINNRIKGSSIGFNTVIVDDTETEFTVSPEDLAKYGLIPEFIGRFTTVSTLHELNVEQLIGVLTSIKNNYIDQYKYLFSLDNIHLEFTMCAIKQIAQKCTGARGLHTQLEKVLLPHMFNIKKYTDVGMTELVINEELVNNPQPLF